MGIIKELRELFVGEDVEEEGTIRFDGTKITTPKPPGTHLKGMKWPQVPPGVSGRFRVEETDDEITVWFERNDSTGGDDGSRSD